MGGAIYESNIYNSEGYLVKAKSLHFVTLLSVFGEGVSLLNYLMIIWGQRREMVCLLLTKMLMLLLLILTLLISILILKQARVVCLFWNSMIIWYWRFWMSYKWMFSTSMVRSSTCNCYNFFFIVRVHVVQWHSRGSSIDGLEDELHKIVQWKSWSLINRLLVGVAGQLWHNKMFAFYLFVTIIKY